MTQPPSATPSDWFIVDEFVDDASSSRHSVTPNQAAAAPDAISLRVMNLTREMIAAKVETPEIVRRVLEIVGPMLDEHARTRAALDIENHIRDYHDSFTG